MDVPAGAEILAASPQQHDAHAGRAVAGHDGVAQRLEELHVHPVRGLGPIERQVRHAVLDVQKNQALVDHGGLARGRPGAYVVVTR